MGQKVKNSFNLKLAGAIAFVILAIFLVREWRTSLILHEHDRINIAVFGERPFVYSYNPRERLAFVVYFNPDYLVNVPGGYGWYKVGSVGYLGSIEKKQNLLLKKAMSELIGAPVDLVFYPKETKVYEFQKEPFREYYQKVLAEKIFSEEYANSLVNFFDKLLIKRLFQVRFDHTVLVGTDDLYVLRQGKYYYDEDILDTRLKGLFYHHSFISQALKGTIVTSEDKYREAKLLLRQLEGMGLKIVQIEIRDNLTNKSCLVQARAGESVLYKAGRLFGCNSKTINSSLVKIIL